MTVMHDFARHLKAKTDAGAILVFDGDVLERPRWRINKRTISVESRGYRYNLLGVNDDPSVAEAELRTRLRAFIEA